MRVQRPRFNREDRADIQEHVCICEQMRNRPTFKFNTFH
jgi:hypothetical protein